MKVALEFQWWKDPHKINDAELKKSPREYLKTFTNADAKTLISDLIAKR